MTAENCVLVELTSREQYLQLLAGLRQRTAYIALVQINDEDAQEAVLAKALDCMQLVEKKYVGKWLGTVRKGRKAPYYLFRADKRFFSFLKEFPSFFFNRKDAWGCDDIEETAFGQDDIAFFDEKQKVLFYTTTHEGYAYADPALLR